MMTDNGQSVCLSTPVLHFASRPMPYATRTALEPPKYTPQLISRTELLTILPNLVCGDAIYSAGLKASVATPYLCLCLGFILQLT